MTDMRGSLEKLRSSKLCTKQQVIVSLGRAIDGFLGGFYFDLTPQDGNKHGGTTVLD